MNDPISNMSFKEMTDACERILGSGPWAHHSLVGLIIEKLQEWKCGINSPFNDNKWFIYHATFLTCIEDKELQRCFLRTAQALGHYSPPQKVKEEPKPVYWRCKADGSIQCIRDFVPAFPDNWERVRVTPWEEKD